MLDGKIVRVRWVKSYPAAHNHVAIGEVLLDASQYLVLLCKTYHFGNHIGGQKGTLRQGAYVNGVLEGEKCIRIIPWSRIEVITELPAKTIWDVKAHIDPAGLCSLANEQKTVITRPPERDL